ncbi:hypothetical protein L53_10655 [Hyphomonas sp. L-53-1-40]|jgi:hypothetical protein|uniref:P-loop NTPase fold protein n=1 Tax=Hyphomonas sp. L-53-1-40 TaxID=1207058 RepID=UPI0004590E4B|nr:P-loop NTPase fold protein [Hyphomonas sp. L-53-1-40]KCZ62548.1 hypothetical protein L53_10655 [Hyphomonas sp. L-53-1-40]
MKSDQDQEVASNLPEAIILHDSPAEEDGFEGNGHRRSATALAAAVKQMANRDGAIGLEGKWGAGKSTVIRFAETELEASNTKGLTHHLMCYDLWAHQSDVFKRSFLEELLQWASARRKNNSSKTLLSKQDVSDFQDRIRDRVKTVRYDVERRFSLTGAVLLLLAPMFPVIVTWLSPIAFSAAVNAKVPPVGWKVAAYISIAIYGLLILRFVIAKLFQKKTWGQAASSTISIFRNQVEDRTEKQNIREEDPSSLEFQKIFRDILEKAQSKDNRIVIVFDNIDRLPAERIVGIWAELRSVFAISSPYGCKQETSVTAIVPYDADLVAQATTKFAPVTFSENADGMVSHQPDLEHRSAPAAELIAKTFDITIGVSPPVSTDWEGFFYSKLNELFGGEEQTKRSVSASARYKLFALFDEQCRGSNKYPTPRQIISFINSIGTLWNQWKGAIPIESLALYSLFRTGIESNPQSLIRPDSIPNSYVRIVDQTDWQKHLSALVFNVDLDKAAQVLLGPSIRKALEIADVGQLDEYAKTAIFNNAVVSQVRSISGSWSRDNVDRLANVATALRSLNQESEAIRLCWRELRISLEDLRQAEPGKFDSYQGLAHFIGEPSNDNPKETARLLTKWSTSNFPSGDDLKQQHGTEWFELFDVFVEELNTRLTKAELQEFVAAIEFPKPPKQMTEFMLGVLLGTADSELIEFSDFKADVDQPGLDKGAVNLSVKLPGAITRIVSAKSPAITIDATKQIGEAIAQELRTKPDPSLYLERYAELLLALRDKYPETDGLIGSLCDDGTLAWHRHQAEQKGKSKTAALYHFLMTLTRTSEQIRSNRPNPHEMGDLAAAWASLDKASGELATDEEYIGCISKRVVTTGLITRWAEETSREGNSGIYTKTFLTALMSDDAVAFDIEKIVQLYPSLADILSDNDRKKLLSRLADSAGEIIDQHRDAKILLIPVSLLHDAKDFEVGGWNPISEEIRKYFSNLDESSWKNVLNNDEVALGHLAFQVQENGFDIPVSSLRPALLSFLTGVLEGEVSVKVSEKLFSHVPMEIAPASRQRVRDDFVTSLEECVVTSQGAQDFFRIFHDFAMTLDFSKSTDRLFEKLVLPLIESRSDSARGFLQAQAKDLSKALSKSSSQTKDQVVNAISALEDSGEMMAVDWAAKLRTQFQLPAPKSPPTDPISADSEDEAKP